ncbi:DUF1217 domain-containing protein [Roseomonas sp. CCTCC AB2023176]|uniref:DUF1217 domain-containing protein n=1 Tax=Roseomonas sp. CCTCC AB2023176 TaxID=3342640 RepID=UPI0035D5C8A1
MTISAALAILGGGTAASTGASAAEALAALRRAAAPGAEEKGVAQLAKDPTVKADLSRFRDAISRAKDVPTAIRDPRVAKVLLPALGLPDAVDKPGLAARALTSDLKDPESVANRLSDSRWKDAARSLNLSARGLDALRDPAVQARLESGYLSYRWRTAQDEATPGVADALYLRERAAAGTAPSVYEVLGNASLRRVVTGALGLPDSSRCNRSRRRRARSRRGST